MRISLYAHVGSKNHGCEALVRSTCKICKGNQITTFSSNPDEDEKYGVLSICKISKDALVRSKETLKWFSYSVVCRLGMPYLEKKYYYLLHCFSDIYMSIGGDNYCYIGFPKDLAYLNNKLTKKRAKTVLWGCSIEPELVKQAEIIEDLKRYSLITARESITYNALLKAGVNRNTKLYPDPAFQLERIDLELPEGFAQSNTVGINVSPMIMQHEEKAGTTLLNYEMLIKHIIDSTNYQIALIPHVVWDSNDDRIPLKLLHDKFKNTGRVVLISDHNCMELKGYIARCKMFIGARTHATIAAYSTCVPTLVVGYSVKAKGIAKDIFKTYENYVIPVQTLKDKDDLINAFEWLNKHEAEIKLHLQNVMPDYCGRALDAGEEVRKLMEIKSEN